MTSCGEYYPACAIVAKHIVTQIKMLQRCALFDARDQPDERGNTDVGVGYRVASTWDVIMAETTCQLQTVPANFRSSPDAGSTMGCVSLVPGTLSARVSRYRRDFTAKRLK